MADTLKTNFAEFTSLIEQISGKRLTDLLRSGADVAQCTGLCDCHGRYCGCYGSVSAQERGDAVILPADYKKLRDLHITALREQLSALEHDG